MEKLATLLVLSLLLYLALVFGEINDDAGREKNKCVFPRKYNFGDSNSDTGGKSAAFLEVPPPNGQTFFGRPFGRVCDGRLIIDLIADRLELQYLSAYLDSISADFRNGANLQRQGHRYFLVVTVLLALLFRFLSFYNSRSVLFCSLIYQQLYNEGAVNFWIHNTGPFGCLPYSVIDYPLKPQGLDGIGCIEYQNKVAREFYEQLKDRILHSRAELPRGAFTYVDIYSAKYQLISSAKKQGFGDPLKFCCGWYNNGSEVACGQTAIVNGTEYGKACSNPTKYISWDGIYYTDAANVCLANSIINGSFSDPPLPIEQSCSHLSTRV